MIVAWLGLHGEQELSKAGSKSKYKTIIIRVGWTYGIGISEINTFSYSGEDDGD